jgi:2-dehydropantoate 2-reductase
VSNAHWHILGAGAIGCLMAARLHAAGCKVTVLLRETQANQSVQLVLEEGRARREITLPGSSAKDAGEISHLLVTTKAYDVEQAVRSIVHRLDGQSQVLLLVNGLGYAQPLLQDFPWLQLFYGTTTQGAYRTAPYQVCHAGNGQTRIGRPGLPAAPAWMSQWQQALPDCRWEADIAQALWLKLAINCAINPLTAVHNCRNGDLASREELAREVAGLCAEIAELTRAQGYRQLAADLHQKVQAVIKGTAENHSSMLQDVRGERRTEIDYITGHLLRVAAQCGVDMPRNQALLEEVLTRGH